MSSFEHNPESIHRLVKRNKNNVYRLALMYCKNKSDADDIFQEVFLRYCKHTPVFENDEHEKAWFLRVTVNCCKSLLKSAWFMRTTALEEEMPAMTKDEQELFTYLRQLPPNYKLVIYLHFYQGYSLVEVADIMGKNQNTIRTYLFRAKKQLKTILEKEEYTWNAN
ncbi:MAG: sigma-70 family RNA polymerase sigma factor [bacterium]|nr:sigma-70 family RNA polymerase sigma factor [bacterium]